MKQYQKFLEKIATHIEKAKAKHPIFAKNVGVKPSQAFDEVSKIQHSNPNTIKGILLEEVYEFLLEAANGNIDDAIEEACDIVAVLVRTIEYLEDANKENNNE